ncbi:hypothetical protein AB205_0207600, partial [Aquarana catesbeiana]
MRCWKRTRFTAFPESEPGLKEGNTCLETGSFLVNYVSCVKCNTRDFVLIANKTNDEEDGEEIITFDHVCKNCHHVIAKHEYTFSVVDEYQVQCIFSVD